MNKSKRHLHELELLKQNGSVDVQELSKLFLVSEMTIRRDLSDLAKEYNISRTYGGAIINSPDLQLIRTSSTVTGITSKNWDQKTKIAKSAASMVKNGQRIFVDYGSTARSLIDFLPEDDNNFIIVTNHLGIAQKSIEKKSCSTILIGGVIMKEASCSFGATAEEQLSTCHLDVAFLGTTAIGSDGYIYDAYTAENVVKRKVLEQAKEIYILVDSSKFNKYDLLTIAHLSEITGIITDAGISDHFRNIFINYGLKLIIAE